MTTETPWLIDKFALVRIGSSPDAELWFDRVERGIVRITTPTLLEVGFSSRSGPDWRSVVQGPPVGLMPVENLTPLIESRAVAVQGIMASRGEHRAPSVPTSSSRPQPNWRASRCFTSTTTSNTSPT